MNSLGKIYNYTIDFNKSKFSNINFHIRDCLCENLNDELHKRIILCKWKLLYSFAHSIIDSTNSYNIPNIIGTHINEKSEIKVKKDKINPNEDPDFKKAEKHIKQDYASKLSDFQQTKKNVLIF